ncbi:DUF4192 family protein [Streptomyces sp. WMMC905]|uniref:DUF4192 domain-containing protein n=1 Tax=Streptomyces sp. WMMC905 TaxID=3404123 RepID=UPI003B9355AC
MTNENGTTGSPEGDGVAGRGESGSPPPSHEADGRPRVTLRTAGELADALPYLLGYRPENSIVLVAVRDVDGRGRLGGRARMGIPEDEGDWPFAARQVAHGLILGAERRGARPERMVAYVCREPAGERSGARVMERLRPLAQSLRVECGALDVPVVEALCISAGRFWSYCCDDPGCCPAEGTPLRLPGTSVLAAAATYAGLPRPGSLSDLHARLRPWESGDLAGQEAALDAAGPELLPRILDERGREEVAHRTLRLARRVMRRLAGVVPGPGTAAADRRDDSLIGHEEAAALLLGLQDRTTRDRAAAWMEGADAAPALRMWRALARRCVGTYGEYAAAPLTLAGWVAWSAGDELEAREALAMALGADADYLFARLLHQACDEGFDPESIRRCLRAERFGGVAVEREEAAGELPAAASVEPTGAAATSSPPANPARGSRTGARARAGGGRRSVARGRGVSGEVATRRGNAAGRRPADTRPPGRGQACRPGSRRAAPEARDDAPRREERDPGGESGPGTDER